LRLSPCLLRNVLQAAEKLYREAEPGSHWSGPFLTQMIRKLAGR